MIYISDSYTHCPAENKSLLPLLQSKPMQQTSVSSVKGHRDVSKGHRNESNAYARVLNKRRELGQPEPDLNLTIFDEPLLLYPSEYRTGSITDDVGLYIEVPKILRSKDITLPMHAT